MVCDSALYSRRYSNNNMQNIRVLQLSKVKFNRWLITHRLGGVGWLNVVQRHGIHESEMYLTGIRIT